jgi:hypothetical protein
MRCGLALALLLPMGLEIKGVIKDRAKEIAEYVRGRITEVPAPAKFQFDLPDEAKRANGSRAIPRRSRQRWPRPQLRR